jgi:hypothetical protein
LRLVEEPDALLLAMNQSDLNQIQNTPIKCKRTKKIIES